MKFKIEHLLPVFKGLRNGLEYGIRLRFVHGVVMTFLFKTFNKNNLKIIFKNAWEHGKKLGTFVFFYKLCCLVLAYLFKQKPFNSFIAGFIVGGLVFGPKTPINYQINLYLLSRIILGLTQYFYNHYMKKKQQASKSSQKSFEKEQQSFLKKYSFRILAGVVWGTVMWLFVVDKKVLQESLTASMQFLYSQSEKEVQNWKQLIPYSKYK